MVAPVEIKIQASVEGAKEVVGLTSAIDDLGKEVVDTGAQSEKAAVGIDRLGKEATETGVATEKAADGIDRLGKEASQTVGQIDATSQAVANTNTSLKNTRPEADKAAAGIKGVGDNAGVATEAMGSLIASMAAGFGVQQFIQAAADMEKMAAGLLAVSGNAEVAKAQMDFVRNMATRAGVDVTAAAEAFLGLAAATKGTAVEGKPAADVYEAVTIAMAKAGKSSADTQNALVALSQIASKGTVSMEELRGQLGEALPGALQAAANGLGVTTQDLIKLVESGQVAAEDIFPALTKGLNELYGTAPGAQTLSQEITNIKNSFVDMSASLGDAGALNALKVGAETAQSAITLLGDTLIVTGQTVGVLAAAVTSLDFSGIPKAMEEIETASRDRLLKAAEHNGVLRDYIKQVGDEATKTAVYVQEMGIKSKASGEQAAGAAPGYTAMSVAYAKVREEIKSQLDLAEKEVQASKARGDAAVAQAKLLGDEAALRAATSKAAADEATALEALAQQRQTEVEVLRAELANKQELLSQSGNVTEAKQKELKDLEGLIEAKQVDADKTLAQAAASRARAQAVSEEVLASQAATQAAEALKTVRVADANVMLSGLQAQKELARQAEEMARLMGNEAQARQAKILQLEIEIKITEAKTNAAKVEADGTIAVAQAKLAELAASGQLTPVKQAEIEASIKLAQAKVVEAEALGKSTTLLQKQIDALIAGGGHMGNYGKATNAATAAVNAQSDALELLNTQYKLSSEYSDRQIALLNKELDARQALLDLKQREIDLENRRRGVDREGFRIDKNGNREVQQLQSQRSVYDNAKGQGLSEADALAIAKRFVSDSGELIGWGSADSSRGESWSTELQEAIDAAVLANAAKAAQAPRQTPASTPASTSHTAIDAAENEKKNASTLSESRNRNQFMGSVYSKTVNGVTYKGSSAEEVEELVRKGSTRPSAPASTPASTSHTVTINLNGQSTRVNTASAGDATALAQVLAGLQSAASRSA